MDQNTIALAISALEAERTRIDSAIAELRGRASGRETTARSTARVVASPKALGRSKRRISAAGRAALAAAAKRRWAKVKAAGKKSL
jgi:hypothetical protein